MYQRRRIQEIYIVARPWNTEEFMAEPQRTACDYLRRHSGEALLPLILTLPRNRKVMPITFATVDATQHPRESFPFRPLKYCIEVISRSLTQVLLSKGMQSCRKKGYGSLHRGCLRYGKSLIDCIRTHTIGHNT